jgi:PBP1b-binding outer membrane lipoprotein LpoB
MTMRYFTIILLALYVSGCASIQPTINGYEAAVVTSLRAAEDQHLKVLAFELCATPLSAAIRHPEIVPALRAACIPAGAEASPALLLETIPGAK